jgi:hypothetical protein
MPTSHIGIPGSGVTGGQRRFGFLGAAGDELRVWRACGGLEGISKQQRGRVVRSQHSRVGEPTISSTKASIARQTARESCMAYTRKSEVTRTQRPDDPGRARDAGRRRTTLRRLFHDVSDLLGGDPLQRRRESADRAERNQARAVHAERQAAWRQA